MASLSPIDILDIKGNKCNFYERDRGLRSKEELFISHVAKIQKKLDFSKFFQGKIKLFHKLN